MSHVISHAPNESESTCSGGGMAARRQPPPPPPPPPSARQKIDDVDTLLNRIRGQSKEKLVRRASVLPEMRGRSSGFVDQLGKHCTIVPVFQTQSTLCIALPGTFVVDLF